jgi:hypothetical protein
MHISFFLVISYFQYNCNKRRIPAWHAYSYLFGIYLKNIFLLKKMHTLKEIPKLLFLISKNYLDTRTPTYRGSQILPP